MPSKKKGASSGSKGNTGGRTASSEPKFQVFQGFAGVNFEHSSRFNDDTSIDTNHDDDADQTDTPMNYMFLQNNVMVATNGTLETRDDLVELLAPPLGATFTGPVCMIVDATYLALSDGNIWIGDIDSGHGQLARLSNVTGSNHTWTSFEWYDSKLIATTKQNELWDGDGFINPIENAVQVPDPDNWFQIDTFGDMLVSTTYSAETPFRFQIAQAWVNKYGPTRVSDSAVFYTSIPVSEWNSEYYVQITGHGPAPQYKVKAVELYYAVDNASSLIFLDRIDFVSGYSQGFDWIYDWYGYVDATTMWPVANLIAPTENYTKGVHASRVTCVDGRLYFWGDPDPIKMGRLYIGGNPKNLLSVSPGTGGGYVDVEPGTFKSIKYVCKFKTQSGNSIVTMLCDSRNSQQEMRFNLVENNISLSNEQNMKSWQAEQVAGAVGCRSYYGAAVCEDGLYTVSRYGLALTTMTMEYNSQIQTNYVSDAIKPVFTDAIETNERLGNSILLYLNGVLYMVLGKRADEDGNYDNVIFCYNIKLKAWWTYTLDIEDPILNLFHVDFDKMREGIGIVTAHRVYLLPTTVSDDESVNADHEFLIQTARLSTQKPQQGWQYLSQIEFFFDYFIGTMHVNVKMTDMFGREINIDKTFNEEDVQYDYVNWMRIDQKVMSYVITMTGTARFRMTHFISKVYTMSNKMTQVYGFDDRISHRSSGSVRPTFKCYNDIRKAIFT